MTEITSNTPLSLGFSHFHCEMCLSIYIVDNAVVAQDHLFIAQPACDVFQSLEVETTPTNLAAHGQLKVRKGKKTVLFVLFVNVANLGVCLNPDGFYF